MWPFVLVATLALVAGCGSAQPPPVGDVPVEREAPGCGAGGGLGFEVSALTREAGRARGIAGGVLVSLVAEGGPAAAGGVRVGDVLVEIDGTDVNSLCTFLTLAWTRTCEPAALVVWRDAAMVPLRVDAVDGLALARRRCAAGDPWGCFRAGWILASRSDNTVNEAEALGLYERACRTGYGAACGQLGHLLLDDEARRRDAPALLVRGCEIGDGTSCANLAYLFATGRHGLRAVDHAEATRLYVRGCEYGDEEACFNVGVNYEQGRGVAVDLARAAAAYDEACEGGSTKACTNLGYAYQHGRGVPADAARAFALYGRGCEGSACASPNLLGCVNVGRAYRDGLGTPANAGEAVRMFERVCDGAIESDETSPTQMWQACGLLGGMHLGGTAPDPDATRGRLLSIRACDGGNAFGCFNAGVAMSRGLGGAVDAQAAAAYYGRACTLGDEEACKLGPQGGTPR
jgi:TPR repeat protein